MTEDPASPVRSRFWSFAGRVLTGLSIVLFLAIVAGAAYQRVMTSRDAEHFPAPGQVALIGSHRVHYRMMGSGTPTVVFDSAIGASSLGWALVQPDVAKFATTVSYDRPGYGWSDPATFPATSSNFVEELHELLGRLKVPKPYVLVGSSFGGCNARLYAFRYPQEVAGLVLVDPAHEDQFKRAPSTAPKAGLLRIFQVASRLGAMRLAGMPVDIAGMNVLTGAGQKAALAAGYRSSAVDAIHAETAAVDESFSELRKARLSAGKLPLGDRPLIVLTRREATPPAGEEAAQYALWVALHRELAAESTRGQQRFVRSGHFIAVDQPSAVVSAIREVVDATRTGPQ